MELLRSRGVNGRQPDLEKTAEYYDYHALALVLVSEYLHTFHDGRVEKALEIPLIANKTKAGRHAMSVMKAYDVALQRDGEELDREMVRMLGLFDRPAEPAAMAALKNAQPIPRLTTLYCKATPLEVEESLARLRQWGLLNPGTDLDAHPLVREWFGEALQTESRFAFQLAHTLLFRHYQRVPKNRRPDTLEELAPLYRAVNHGCSAKVYQEAFAHVYMDRIQRGNQFYNMNTLGNYSSDLSAISGFFPFGFENMPVDSLVRADRNWLVGQLSYLLVSLGRLTEAVWPQKVSVQLAEQEEDWSNAAIYAQNLTDLLLPLGKFAEAMDAVCKGMGFVEKIVDGEKRLFQKMVCSAYQARVAHMQGRFTEASTAFKRAEELQMEKYPSFPRLNSLRGTRYAEFLLECVSTLGEREEVLDRGRYIGGLLKGRPMEKSLGNLITGLALASLDRIQEALPYMETAVVDMRRAGRSDKLPWILLAHAKVLHHHGDFDLAKMQISEAQEIGERGEMRLYLADSYLLAGEIALDEGRQALEEYNKAKQLISEMGYERRWGELLLLRARIHKSPRLFLEALAHFRKLGQLGLLDWYKDIQV
ncbi:MAG: hypothetical protein G8345_22420 [Magnetococcales bacterium]|nr:hypothetical protein [Magnetococcales bacterium]